MDTKRLQELAGIIIEALSKDDKSRYRRMVILSIFNSPNIVNELKSTFRKFVSSPDKNVSKVCKIYLAQIENDEQSINNNTAAFDKIKKYPEFQKISKDINNKLIYLSNMDVINFASFAFAQDELKEILSYSTWLLKPVTELARNLYNTLNEKYPDFVKGKNQGLLYDVLPSKPLPGYTLSENLDELSGEEERNEFNLDYNAEKLDSRIGTNLAFKNYIFPTGYPEDKVKEIILKGSDEDKLNAFNTIITVNTKLNNISGIKNTKDIDNITYTLSCMVKHVPPEDIKFYFEEFIPIEKSAIAQSYQKAFFTIQEKFDVAIGWLPNNQNAMKIIDAINRKNDIIK